MTTIHTIANSPGSSVVATPNPYADIGIANMLIQLEAVRIRLRLAGIITLGNSLSAIRYPACTTSAIKAKGSTSQVGAIVEESITLWYDTRSNGAEFTL